MQSNSQEQNPHDEIYSYVKEKRSEFLIAEAIKISSNLVSDESRFQLLSFQKQYGLLIFYCLV